MTGFVDEFREEFGVEPICRVLPIASSTFHARKAAARDPSRASPRMRRDAGLKDKIRKIWSDNRKLYGARKVWHTLKRDNVAAARCSGPGRRCRTSSGRQCTVWIGTITSASSDRSDTSRRSRPNGGILIGCSRWLRSHDALNEMPSGQVGAVHYYYQPKGETEQNLGLMRQIDGQFLETPFFGVRQMTWHLRNDGHFVNEMRIRRLMRLMGLMPIYQKPNTSRPAKGHKTYPHLLRGLRVDRPNQVWCSDITYLPMRRGFLYLVAIMDRHTRKVLSWRISNTLEADFGVEALKEAIHKFGPMAAARAEARALRSAPGGGAARRAVGGYDYAPEMRRRRPLSR
ncbi:hypothetical protein B5V46_13775 [Rhodovulum sp. MB263]|nr:hypothetical protein B5V46_13775 [Rhodovulum sp. MB263]